MISKDFLNYSHCDIYDLDNPLVVKGEALSAKMSLERERMLEIFNVIPDENDRLVHRKLIHPPCN